MTCQFPTQRSSETENVSICWCHRDISDCNFVSAVGTDDPVYQHEGISSHTYEYTPVASFTKEVNPQLAKCPLVLNGRLANHGLTSLVKEATVHYQLFMG